MNTETDKTTKTAYLRCDIMNLLEQAARLSVEELKGGVGIGVVMGAQLACELLEKIARRAWAIRDEELMCMCYRMGLVEQTPQMNEWFNGAMARLKEKKDAD